MNVKQYRKLKAGIFVRAAEMMEQGNINGACSAIKEAMLEADVKDYYGGYTSVYHKMMDVFFKPEGGEEAIGTVYYFGPPMKWWREGGREAALEHRIYALLMLAAMVQQAKK